MSDLRAFFTLVGRDAIFWLGALGLGCLSIFLVAITQPHAPTVGYVDAFILVTLAYPALAGWLAGALILELQNCTFTWVLPGVPRKVSRGFFVFGAITIFIVVGLVTLQDSPYDPIVLGALGLASYCLGANFFDPGKWYGSWIAVLLTLALVFSTNTVGEMAFSHPGSTALVALAAAAFFSHGLLRLSTFRKGPSRLATPLPGAFFLQRSQRLERRKQALLKSSPRGWKLGYLGENPWKWVRAGVHETYGPLTLRVVGKAIASTWVLWLLIGIHAWTEGWSEGQGASFWEAVGKTVFDVLFRSPHVPAFGEKGPYAMVVFVIAALGAMLCLRAPASPNSGVLYPLSRRAFARVAFRGAQVETAIYFLAITFGFLLVGLGAGALLGYETRLDFLPFFMRPLMATMVLLPLLQFGRLRLRSQQRQADQNGFLLVAGGIIGFVTLVSIWTYFAPQIFRTTRVEIVAFLVLLVTSRLLYWVVVKRHFASADLA
jgi:hypothetical protein